MTRYDEKRNWHYFGPPGFFPPQPVFKVLCAPVGLKPARLESSGKGYMELFPSGADRGWSLITYCRSKTRFLLPYSDSLNTGNQIIIKVKD